MKIKQVLTMVGLICFIFLVACHSDSNDSSEVAKDDSAEDSEGGMTLSTEEHEVEEDRSQEDDRDLNIAGTDRMIIHQAYLHVQVKDLTKTQDKIEENVKEYKGYIVDSNVFKETDDQLSGHLTVRIPEEHFQEFLSDTEEVAKEVLERNVSGQDVTEEYVDLESRLKSKEVVEKRLLEFIDDAEKTEDLLKISSDLSDVQEEIETIIGKMDYLENQTDYSTVDLQMDEDHVTVPNVEGKNLDTWDKTKKQLAKSVNFILAAASGLVVFVVGNIPVIMIVLLVALIIYLFTKRRRNK